MVGMLDVRMDEHVASSMAVSAKRKDISCKLSGMPTPVLIDLGA